MSASPGPNLRRFRDLVNGALGRDAVIEAPDETSVFTEDARGGHGCAAAVVMPKSTEEVSLVVRSAAATGIRLIPQGANTGLVSSGVPADGARDVVLSLRAMNHPPQIDAVNRTALVEAGVLLSTLNAAAAELDLFFPIDLAADPSVGGLIATNAGGSRFVRYGDVRRNVLGLEVVLADEKGTVLDLLRPLWKNNTGLDLKQLFVGSSGSLGVITRAVLALQPRPSVTVTALFVPRDEAAVTEALVALERQAGPALTAFEGMSGAAMEAAIRLVPAVRNPFADQPIPPFAVLVELSGGPADTEERLVELLADALSTLSGDGSSDRVTSVLLGKPAELWALRHAIPEALRKRGRVIACDVAVSRSQWPRLRAELVKRLSAEWPQVAICDFGHVGDGGLHFNLVWPAEAPEAPAGTFDAIRSRVFAIVAQEFGGAFSAEHGIGPRNIGYYQAFTAAGVLELAGRLQRALCPVGIGRVSFGPGRNDLLQA